MGSQSPPARIERLSVTPVKGTRLAHPASVSLETGGAREDRLFHLIDERNRMLNGKQLGALSTICADYDGRRGHLRVTFADGRGVSGDVELGATLDTRFYSSVAPASLVLGPFSAAFSEQLGRHVRLVKARVASGAVDRGAAGGVSLIGQASVARLAREAGEPHVDARRFRMLIEVSGIAVHEEDQWVGRKVAIGAAVVAMRGHVGRCLVTSRDPDTGEVDLPTLELLGGYRRQADTTEPLALGIYGEVLERATIAVGDTVALL